MSLAVQGSLFDHDERRNLGAGAWIDVRAGWLNGWLDEGGTLFDELLEAIPWRAERRQMYDRVLAVPRLVSFHDLTAGPAPHPAIARLRRRLNDIYAGELGEPFTSAGLCLYRDGTDSVAWHGDTVGRSSTEDTMVAIVSLGARRTFAMRPRTGERSPGSPGRHHRSLRLPQGHGDLLVMGGSCQRTWEHAVPKTARPTGPRISIQFRPRDVR
ncbi:DNA repair protein [Mycobacterium adipatum]|uniref:DNA repair protein n=1 Tax=Mycobacterium adipatum TaxID=1682113 RepID=A0A172UT27_9MYCO|nr:alpha-ketoglutarate-dependent dioxygenase AlkB [Mycobacterium adipatum]ANE81944.1 DNA repair protein [Mycobacterium adipatum]MBI5737178.1 alpha-ketoglutarate-dependent dioxygenase AlkB [Mycolicibacterium neoaurum]